MGVMISGKVTNEVVDTTGGDFTYDLKLDGRSIDTIFRRFLGSEVKVTIERVERHEDDEDYN